LEINLLSFIPLILKTNNLYSSESSLKYFLTQALARRVLLFSIILFFFLNIKQLSNLNYFLNILFMSSLIIKIGIAPFHF